MAEAATAAVAGPTVLRRLRAPLVTAAAVGAGTVLVVVRDPHVEHSYGFCPLLLFAGYACPLCGGLRSTHDLAHLDVAGAWAANPLWVVLAPTLVVLWAVWLVRRARGRSGPYLPSWTALSLLGVLTAFAVLRNVPFLVPYLTPWL
ncbi:DUF2752 domain-containing protein [Myceligenerans cantabricum]